MQTFHHYCRLMHQMTQGIADVLVVVLALMMVFVVIVGVVKKVIVVKTKNKHKKIRKKNPSGELTIDHGYNGCCS